MKSAHIEKLVQWFRRFDPAYSASRLFSGAYADYHGACDEEATRRDISLFYAYGHVPYYVQRFVVQKLHPKFLCEGNSNPENAPADAQSWGKKVIALFPPKNPR